MKQPSAAVVESAQGETDSSGGGGASWSTAPSAGQVGAQCRDLRQRWCGGPSVRWHGTRRNIRTSLPSSIFPVQSAAARWKSAPGSNPGRISPCVQSDVLRPVRELTKVLW